MTAINILQQLLSFKSVTPNDDGAIQFINNFLTESGFQCETIDFQSNNSYKVTNLYARFGNQSPNFCFAGHTDVVPVGDEKAWSYDPFKGIVDNEKIYGRGTVDMKGAIAAMLMAAKNFVQDHPFQGSISFLMTGDEESLAIDGTQKLLEHITKQGEKLDICLVGEPTNKQFFGDMIKIGRRGSISFNLEITGTQGHVAYPQNTDNPITNLIKILHELKLTPLDKGTDNFEPSNLEITNIEINNKADNVIPSRAKATFNIRFNDRHTKDDLVRLVDKICKQHAAGKYHLIHRCSGEAFITDTGNFKYQLQQVVTTITGRSPVFSTEGGTSDARFIKNYCPVIEFGLINKTAHKINEHALITDIENLTNIYYNLLKKYFSIG